MTQVAYCQQHGLKPEALTLLDQAQQADNHAADPGGLINLGLFALGTVFLLSVLVFLSASPDANH